jgi:O-antigen/teichoic acid export membrane protein
VVNLARSQEGRPVSESHASLYLASRATGALINAASVAVFTRMSSASLYGEYLVGFAICFIIYGLALQWPVYAHFGNYRRSEAGPLAGALLVISVAALIPALLVLFGMAWFNALPGDIASGGAVLLVCFTLFFAATELGRSHLLVGTVAIGTLARSVLSLACGVGMLLAFGTANALLIGVGIGYAVGALPVFLVLGRSTWRSGFVWPSGELLGRVLRYGWPLIVAYGTGAAALNIDRLLLEHFYNAATVAPYGAVLDFMKQTFLVVAEAVAIGYISYARTLHTDGAAVEAGAVLKRAFVAQAFLVVFGIAFFLLLGDTLFAILLAPGYLPIVREILPLLLVANALLVLRAYYIGQVIYFDASSKLEFAASVVMLVLAAGASYLLIPPYGPIGAALAFTLGQVGAIACYVVLTPRELRLPIDWPRAGILALCGAAIVLVGKIAELALGRAPAVAVDLVLLTGASLFFLLRWNLFDAFRILQRVGARWRTAAPDPNG